MGPQVKPGTLGRLMATLDGLLEELGELKARFPSPDAALVDELLKANFTVA